MSERTLNAVQAALLVVAAFFFGLSAGKWYVEQTNYRAGYAAAVDSVRACAWRTDVIRVLDAYGASYTVTMYNAAGRETSMVRVGGVR